MRQEGKMKTTMRTESIDEERRLQNDEAHQFHCSRKEQEAPQSSSASPAPLAFNTYAGNGNVSSSTAPIVDFLSVDSAGIRATCSEAVHKQTGTGMHLDAPGLNVGKVEVGPGSDQRKGAFSKQWVDSAWFVLFLLLTSRDSSFFPTPTICLSLCPSTHLSLSSHPNLVSPSRIACHSSLTCRPRVS